MDRRVVITGVGAITPIGCNVKTMWNNMVNGVCGIKTITAFDTTDLPVKVGGQINDFKPAEHGIKPGDARKNDPFALYAMAAANEAMADAGDLNIAPEKLGVYVGSGIGGMQTFVKEAVKLEKEGPRWTSPLFIPMMISNMASGNIAIAHNAQGPCVPIVTACSTGTHSIGEAFRAVKHGYADAIIAGGAEAALTPLAICGFANSKALTRTEDPLQASIPFDKRRAGFVIAEGAGIVIVEEYERAVKRGAKIYAEIVGYGNTDDANHYTAPRPDGSTQSRAIKEALDGGKYTSDDSLYINAHGTSTHLNDSSETLAYKLALGEENARKAMISSTKSMTGHMLGATGAVEIIAAALALGNNIVPPTIGYKEKDPECDLDYTPNEARKVELTMAISTTLGFGGHNACLALRKVK